MRSQRSILALRYTPVSVAGGVRRAVGGFLRYVQYRDQHLEPETSKAVDAYVRYVAHRDRTSPGGRVFGPDGERSDQERRQFVDYIARSTKGLIPRWVLGRDGKQQDHQRAVYTFILSPEDWRGLDLRRLACTAMRQLEADAGPNGIGPWFAAEHRNTVHHHVHIVLAARREVSPGRFAMLVVTRARLQRMKDAIALEIDRQRGVTREPTAIAQPQRRPSHLVTVESMGRPPIRWQWAEPTKSAKGWPRRQRGHVGLRPIGPTILHLRAVARRYRARMQRELEQEALHAEREGWIR